MDVTLKVMKEENVPVYNIWGGANPREGVDHIFVDFNPSKQFDVLLHVCMHTGEHTNGQEVLKLKCWCEKHNYGLCFYGHLNQFPLLSLVADQMLLTTYRNTLDGLYSTKTSGYIWPFSDGFFPYFVDKFFYNLTAVGKVAWGASLPPLLKIADAEVSTEEVVERFKDPVIWVRKSGFDLYNRLVQEGVVQSDKVLTEIKNPGNLVNSPLFTELKTCGDRFNFEVLPEEYRTFLLSRCGLNLMNVTILCGILSNWVYVCSQGSSNLFAFLPVKTMSLNDFYYDCDIVRGLAIARFGELGKVFPFLLDYTPHSGPLILSVLRQFDKYAELFRRYQSFPIDLRQEECECRMIMTPDEEKFFKVKSARSFQEAVNDES